MIHRDASFDMTFHARGWQRAVSLAFLLPFLLFATISQGTMLEFGPAGIRLVLCSEDGMVETVMAPDGQVHRMDGPDLPHSPEPHPCDWALHSQPAVTGGWALPAAGHVMVVRADYVVDVPLHARRVDVLTPAARGPPPLI